MKHTKALFIIIIAFVISFKDSFCQSHLCKTCNNPIEGNYVIAGNNYFHPEHFICEHCKKPLPDKFMSESNKYYHEECFALVKDLICDFCKKIITSEYLISKNKKYHKHCFENVLPRCSICEKALYGEYSVDFYGNKYHTNHEKELERCTACNRFITESLTSGGKTYSDGRSICNICYPEVVFDNARISGLLEKVRTKLSSYGLSLTAFNISVKGVSSIELKNVAGNYYSKGVKGFCETNSERINGDKPKYSHRIFVLNGLPAISIEAIIAHELMHVWFSQNTKRNHAKQITEGSCNYISYLYLQSQAQNNFVKQLIAEIENDPSTIYGDGFRKIKDKFSKKNIPELLNYLRNN